MTGAEWVGVLTVALLAACATVGAKIAEKLDRVVRLLEIANDQRGEHL